MQIKERKITFAAEFSQKMERFLLDSAVGN